MGDNLYRLPPYQAKRIVNPMSELRDWSMDLLGIPKLWEQTRGKGVLVAVLDTGVDTNHPDLQGAIKDARDFTGSMFGPEDRQGHGTWCVSSIAARQGNSVGIAGIAPDCQVISGKVLGDDGSGTDNTIERGMKWAMEMGADIVSLSLGGPDMGQRLLTVFREYLSVRGRFIFAAAGNDGKPNSVNYPAKWPECICVAAVDKQGRIARFSSRGPRVDIAAPGVELAGAAPGGGYVRMSGTSMATPIAAGVGALCLAKHQEHGGQSDLNTYADMREHLRKTAIDKGTPGQDSDYGFGLINPDGLLALHPVPVVPPVVAPKPTANSVSVVIGGKVYSGPLTETGVASVDTAGWFDG